MPLYKLAAFCVDNLGRETYGYSVIRGDKEIFACTGFLEINEGYISEICAYLRVHKDTIIFTGEAPLWRKSARDLSGEEMSRLELPLAYLPTKSNKNI